MDGCDFAREKVTIKRSRPHVTLIGHPTRQTIIVWNDTASSRDRLGRPLRTFYSATVAVNSNYFIAHNLTFMVPLSYSRPSNKQHYFLPVIEILQKLGKYENRSSVIQTSFGSLFIQHLDSSLTLISSSTSSLIDEWEWILGTSL